MKTTIDIPDPLFRQAKSRAAERGQTLKEFVTDLDTAEDVRQLAQRTGWRQALPAVPGTGSMTAPVAPVCAGWAVCRGA